MFTIFLEYRLLSSIMLFFLLLSIICQITVGVIYRRLIRETENMSSTENKILKQCKLKFTNCFQLNGGVSNIPVFVDKFISRVTVMRITLRGLQHLSGQMMLLSVLTAGIGACMAIVRGETIGRLLPYYIISFLGLYAYFAVSGMVDIQGKRERLKVHLIDYLENHMVNKLRQTALDQVLIAPESAQQAEVNYIPVSKAEIQTDSKSEEDADKDTEKCVEMKSETKSETKSEKKDRRLAEAKKAKAAADTDKPEITVASVKAPAELEVNNPDSDQPAHNEKKIIFSQQEKKELEELLQEFLVL